MWICNVFIFSPLCTVRYGSESKYIAKPLVIVISLLGLSSALAKDPPLKNPDLLISDAANQTGILIMNLSIVLVRVDLLFFSLQGDVFCGNGNPLSEPHVTYCYGKSRCNYLYVIP